MIISFRIITQQSATISTTRLTLNRPSSRVQGVKEKKFPRKHEGSLDRVCICLSPLWLFRTQKPEVIWRWTGGYSQSYREVERCLLLDQAPAVTVSILPNIFLVLKFIDTFEWQISIVHWNNRVRQHLTFH